MNLKKRFFKHPLTISVLCWLIARFIRFTFATNRLVIMENEQAKPYVAGEKNAVFVFWHGRLMMMPMFCPPSHTMHVMISHHNDGELIARAMHQFNFSTVRGSSRRGARGAVTGAVAALEAGDNICITPDGPRGPARVAAAGAAHISSMCGVPVIPVSIGASRRIHLGSWDKFMVALPFGRLVFMVGEPVWVEQGASDNAIEAASQQIQERLNSITDLVDLHTRRVRL